MTNRLTQNQPAFIPAGDSAYETNQGSRSLWGARYVDRTVASGLFVCPQEGIERAYWKHRVRNWFSILSVPLIPGGVVGEYVECFCCGSSSDPRTVGAKHPALGTLHVSA